MNVKVTFDPKYDVAYIRVREGRSVKQEEVAPGVVMDVSEDGLPLGFEFLNARATFGGEPTGVSFEMDSREPAATKG